MDSETAERLGEHLDQFGLTIDGSEAMQSLAPGNLITANLRRLGSRQRYLLTYLPDMTFTRGSQLAREQTRHPLLVLGERITERSANSFREAGIQYLDADGNAYIAFGTVLIDVRGRSHTSSGPRRIPVDRPTNLFSPRRARVVFALIAWPELSRAKVREIATAAGVSLGLAQETRKLLGRNGYLSSAEPRELRDRHELLDYWAAAYPSGLAPTLALAEFAGGVDDVRPIDGNRPLYLSGESAVPQALRPISLTIYLDQMDPRLAVINRWRADGRPNIFVRRKFWTDPSRKGQGSETPEPAPWPLVYADLMAAGEPRQREAAQDVREEHVGLRKM